MQELQSEKKNTVRELNTLFFLFFGYAKECLSSLDVISRNVTSLFMHHFVILLYFWQEYNNIFSSKSPPTATFKGSSLVLQESSFPEDDTRDSCWDFLWFLECFIIFIGSLFKSMARVSSVLQIKRWRCNNILFCPKPKKWNRCKTFSTHFLPGIELV